MHALGWITKCAAAGLIFACGTAHADFSPVGDMEYARVGARSVRLGDDSVLVIGGADNAEPLASAERFDPSSGTFSKTVPMHDARDTAIAVRLADGRVLVAGGFTMAGLSRTAEIFDPAKAAFEATGSMEFGRVSAVAAAQRAMTALRASVSPSISATGIATSVLVYMFRQLAPLDQMKFV